MEFRSALRRKNLHECTARHTLRCAEIITYARYQDDSDRLRSPPMAMPFARRRRDATEQGAKAIRHRNILWSDLDRPFWGYREGQAETVDCFAWKLRALDEQVARSS